MATAAALLFVPTAMALGILLLMSERVSRCVTQGECQPGLPGWMFEWSAGVGAAALLVALVAPASRVRRAALVTQVLAEAGALLVILSYA
ncbi:hypothetical protein [Streptomyces sp. NPDC048361]|uniref:hypothetical protein n=1 Tax=Streptomyces sp. NPDC048361 TaxID=3154720 RepID=UPI003417A4AD